jgi:hypothetical protein
MLHCILCLHSLLGSLGQPTLARPANHGHLSAVTIGFESSYFDLLTIARSAGIRYCSGSSLVLKTNGKRAVRMRSRPTKSMRPGVSDAKSVRSPMVGTGSGPEKWAGFASGVFSSPIVNGRGSRWQGGKICRHQLKTEEEILHLRGGASSRTPAGEDQLLRFFAVSGEHA